MDLGLAGKKVIINGGAHGLGLASLKIFAAEGADVAFSRAMRRRSPPRLRRSMPPGRARCSASSST